MDNDSIAVLIVDDEPGFLKITGKTLGKQGWDIATAESASQAIEQMETKYFDVIVSDVKMPGMDGIELLRKLNQERPTQQVVMISGHANAEMAVEVMKLGAFDFLIKPFKADILVRAIERAADHGKLERKTFILEEELVRTKGLSNIVGESESVKKIFSFITTSSASDMPVLITGESGTGKELVAQAIHAASKRCSNPLVVVDGSTLRTELLVSELFGHEKGAFTGASKKKPGLFEVANRGTVFLDEIGELSAENQAALLRVLETGTFRPVGSVREVHTDVRIIAATNRDIKQAVESGDFRDDLFYRLKGLAIHVPPLRERKEDIHLLVNHFLALHNQKMDSQVEISSQALETLKTYHWPGNIRELKHTIELGALMAWEEKIPIQAHHLPEELSGRQGFFPQNSTGSGWNIHIPEGTPTLEEFKNICEKEYLSRLLQEFNSNKAQVRRILDISSSVLYPKLRKLGLLDEKTEEGEDDS